MYNLLNESGKLDQPLGGVGITTDVGGPSRMTSTSTDGVDTGERSR